MASLIENLKATLESQERAIEELRKSFDMRQVSEDMLPQAIREIGVQERVLRRICRILHDAELPMHRRVYDARKQLQRYYEAEEEESK